MNGKTHIAGALALTSAVSLLSIKTGTFIDKQHFFLQQGTLLAASGLGGLLPDIDHKNSTITKSNPVAGFFIRLFLTHRGFTHSLLSLAIISAFTWIGARVIGSGYGYWVVSGFSIGYASHILLDSLNPKGVPLFYPLKKKFSFGKIKTGGRVENLVFIGLVLGTVFLEMILVGMR